MLRRTPLLIVLLLVIMCLPGCKLFPDDDTKVAPTPVISPTACYTSGCPLQWFLNRGPLLSTSGDPLFDARFTQEIAIQYQFFNGCPATVYLWDDSFLTGFWTSTDHCILIGINAMRYFGWQYGELTIAGFLAHEWGHIVQEWQFPSVLQGPSVQFELEADAFSGFYMGYVKSWAWDQVNLYFAAMYNVGEPISFTRPQTHGTPEQRLAAAQIGYLKALQVRQTGQMPSWTDLHNEFYPGVTKVAQGAPN